MSSFGPENILGYKEVLRHYAWLAGSEGESIQKLAQPGQVGKPYSIPDTNITIQVTGHKEVLGNNGSVELTIDMGDGQSLVRKTIPDNGQLPIGLYTVFHKPKPLKF